MARKPTFRQLLVSFLAGWRDLSLKQIGVAAGIPQKRVSLYLRRGEIPDEALEKLLAAVDASPAAVLSITACLESLEAFERETDLTREEKAEIAEAMLRAGRVVREGMIEVVRHSHTSPVERKPEARSLAWDREQAAELFRRLESLSREARVSMIQTTKEFRSWALCERLCEASEREASRNLERAMDWAQLARQVAEEVGGTKEWRNRIQGYATAHVANILRVSGNLVSAESHMHEAKRLWRAGSDPAGALDPGRLLDLEASLRRDQRRLPEALALLDAAASVGRRPERALLKKGYTLEVMGEYEQAVDTLLRATPLVEQKGEPRLERILSGNLALIYCHLGRFMEAAELTNRVRAAAIETGDEIEVVRMTWTQGRIAAGLGRSGEAKALLAQARREFAFRGMDYDVALALLEESALLLDEGRLAEVKILSGELVLAFDVRGIHREALAALDIFKKAAQQERATAELARRVLEYLFRVRHDPGLRFFL